MAERKKHFQYLLSPYKPIPKRSLRRYKGYGTKEPPDDHDPDHPSPEVVYENRSPIHEVVWQEVDPGIDDVESMPGNDSYCN